VFKSGGRPHRKAVPPKSTRLDNAYGNGWEPVIPPAQDAAQLMELLRKAIEQGALKTPVSQPAAA
jgi:hypothetical protein